MKRYEACSYIAGSAKEASNKFREDCAKEKGVGVTPDKKKKNKKTRHTIQTYEALTKIKIKDFRKKKAKQKWNRNIKDEKENALGSKKKDKE